MIYIYIYLCFDKGRGSDTLKQTASKNIVSSFATM